MSANFSRIGPILFCTAIFIVTVSSVINTFAQTRRAGQIEQVFAFQKQMPTGITVSQKGRIFVNYPRWENTVDFIVAEIVNGHEVRFPDANINRLNLANPGEPPMHIRLGVDGIAISADGSRIYYCPLASRKLYSISSDALLDPNLSETDVAQLVKDEGAKPTADGLESDAQGKVYVTDFENRGIKVRGADIAYTTLVEDPKVVWADTMSVAANGYLYFTGNQLNRQAGYNNGRDLRKKPYHLFRVKIDGTLILLR